MLAARVEETATISSNGTANFTLNGATTNFQTFNSAFGTNSAIRYYAVKGSQWEEGHGYMSSSTVLVRQIVTANSAGTFAKINFTDGTVTIFCSMGPNSFLPAVPVHNSGVWVKSEHLFGGLVDGGKGMAAGYTYCAPFYYSAPNQIDAISFSVNTPVAGSFARVALMTSSPTAHQPRDVIYQSGELSTAASGWVEYILPAPISITGRLIWTALICNNGINVVAANHTQVGRCVQESTRSSGFSATRNVIIDDRGSGWTIANGGSGISTFGLDGVETSGSCPLVMCRTV